MAHGLLLEHQHCFCLSFCMSSRTPAFAFPHPTILDFRFGLIETMGSGDVASIPSMQYFEYHEYLAGIVRNDYFFFFFLKKKKKKKKKKKNLKKKKNKKKKIKKIYKIQIK